MNTFIDNDQTFVKKIVNDFRSDNRPKSSRICYDSSIDLSSNDSLLPNKRRRSCSPELQESMITPVSSPWESRRIKQDLMNARSEIFSLQERNKKLFNIKKESDILFEKEKAALEHNIIKLNLTLEQVDNKLKEIRGEKLNLLEEKNNLKDKLETTLEENQRRILILEKQNMELEVKLTNVNLELTKFKNDSALKNCTDYELNELKSTLKSNDKYIEELTNTLRKKQVEINTLENDKVKMNTANQRIKTLENELDSYRESAMVVNAQREKLKRFSSMESELILLREETAKYRNDVKQTEILENKVNTLESKLSQHELIEKEAIQLRSNLAICEDSLKKWTDVCLKVCENITLSQCFPEYLCYYVDDLKKKDLLLVNEKGELQSSIAQLELKFKQIENELIKAKEQIIMETNNNSKNEIVIKRLKKQLYIVTWERNDLRELIDSFEKDATVVGNMEDTKIDILDKAINGYKTRMTQIEADPSLFIPTDNDKRWIEEKHLLLKEKEELINKCKQLEDKCTNLSDQMEHRSLKGDFNLRETKVIHFKMNPASQGFTQHENELSNAKQEIEKLKERIKAMQEGISMNLTQVVDNRVDSMASHEVSVLREKLKTQEIQNQRLIEAYKNSSKEYRESVYALLGYKFDGLQNNMYRLTSQFAFHEEDNLIFQFKEGSMQLLETPFSKSIGEMINLHLGQQHSIPVLLSSLTIDLFSKQSMIVTADSTRFESTIN